MLFIGYTFCQSQEQLSDDHSGLRLEHQVLADEINEKSPDANLINEKSSDANRIRAFFMFLLFFLTLTMRHPF